MKRRPMSNPIPAWQPLPPAEAPAEEVSELLERLHAFRERLADAERMQHMVEQGLHDLEDPTPAERTYYRVEIQVARNRSTLWKRQIIQLERSARAKGLQP